MLTQSIHTRSLNCMKGAFLLLTLLCYVYSTLWSHCHVNHSHLLKFLFAFHHYTFSFFDGFIFLKVIILHLSHQNLFVSCTNFLLIDSVPISQCSTLVITVSFGGCDERFSIVMHFFQV